MKKSRLDYYRNWRSKNKDYHKNYNREHKKNVIYMFINANEVLYIGGTNELSMRLSYHRTVEKEGKLLEISKELGVEIKDIEVKYLELIDFNREERDLMEAHFIKLYKPRFNSYHNNDKHIDEEKVKDYISCLSDNWCTY